MLSDVDGLSVDPGAYDSSACRAGATCDLISDVIRVNTSSNFTIVVFEPPETGGNGTCSGGLFDELSGSARTCQAGCCVNGACVCREGFVGARCEAQLRCGGATSPGDSLWDFDACETILLPEGQSRAICSCTGLEFVSVLSHRLRPASALLDSLDPEWTEWPHELYGGLRKISTLAGEPSPSPSPSPSHPHPNPHPNPNPNPSLQKITTFSQAGCGCASPWRPTCS